ncbi:TPA: hypothetical protein DCZ36_03490 [Candidatus Gracilibacteria bacterium]|nr:hypothetical protein [Candidatus Gracilibacteria bacterium]
MGQPTGSSNLPLSARKNKKTPRKGCFVFHAETRGGRFETVVIPMNEMNRGKSQRFGFSSQGVFSKRNGSLLSPPVKNQKYPERGIFLNP